jgi:hypothetical protein
MYLSYQFDPATPFSNEQLAATKEAPLMAVQLDTNRFLYTTGVDGHLAFFVNKKTNKYLLVDTDLDTIYTFINIDEMQDLAEKLLSAESFLVMQDHLLNVI